MNERLKRKCLFVSVAMHTLLVVIVLMASAFKGKVEEPVVKPMTVIDTDTINRLLVSAPAPTPAPAPAPVVETPTPPPPKPAPKPEPKPEPKPPVKQPDPPKPKPVETKPPPKKITPKPTPKKVTPKKVTPKPKPQPRPRPQVKVNTSALKNLVPKRDLAAERRERERIERERKAAAAAEARRVAALKNRIKSVTTFKGSESVKVNTGSAARASIDYGTYVKQAYDRHWRQPSGLSKGLRAEITVTIRRDGSVKSARVSRKSGVARFDNALQALADKVRSFRSFPSAMSESEKTFTCGFLID